MSNNDPSIPTLFVANANPATNNERIRLGEGREDLELGGPAQLLTQEEFDSFPSRLQVVLEREGSEPEDMQVKELKAELDAAGVSYRGNASQKDLAAQVTELRAAQAAQTIGPESSGGSQLTPGDNPAVAPVS